MAEYAHARAANVDSSPHILNCKAHLDGLPGQGAVLDGDSGGLCPMRLLDHRLDRFRRAEEIGGLEIREIRQSPYSPNRANEHICKIEQS